MATFQDFLLGANFALWEEAIADILQDLEDQREAALNSVYLSTALIQELADRYGVLVGAKPDPSWQLEVFREHLQEVIQAYLMMSSTRAGVQQTVAATTQIPPILRPIGLLQRWLLGFQYLPNRFFRDLDAFVQAEIDNTYTITNENNLLVLKINGVEQSIVLPTGELSAGQVIDAINATIIGARAFPFGKRFVLETIETDEGGSIQVKVESTADTLFGLDTTERDNAPVPGGSGVLPFGWRLTGSYIPPPPLVAEDPIPTGTHSQPISFDGALFGVGPIQIVGSNASPFVGLLTGVFLKNGGFEDGFSEWDHSGGPDFFISVSKSRSGTKSLAVVTRTAEEIDPADGRKTIVPVTNVITTAKKFIPEGCTVEVNGYHQASTPGEVFLSAAVSTAVFEWLTSDAVLGYSDQQFSKTPLINDPDAATFSLFDSSVNFITTGVKVGMAVHVVEGNNVFDGVVKGVSTHQLLIDQWRNGPDGGPTVAYISNDAPAGSGVTYTLDTLQDPAMDFTTLGVQVGSDFRTRDKLRVDETISHFGQITTERQIVRDITAISTTTNPNDTLTLDAGWGASPTPTSATGGSSGNPYFVYLRPHNGAQYAIFQTLNEVPDFADDFAHISASFLYEARFFGFDGRLIHSDHHFFRPTPSNDYEFFSFQAIAPLGAENVQLAITVEPDDHIAEDTTAVFDSPIHLSQQHVAVDSERLVVQQSGTVLARGPAPNGDYDIDYEAGTITLHADGRAAKPAENSPPLLLLGDTVTVEYEFEPKGGALVSIDDIVFHCAEGDINTEFHVAVDQVMQKVVFKQNRSKASGTITYTLVPADGDTITIGDETYEFDEGAHDSGTINYTGNPADGNTITIGSNTFEFDSDCVVNAGHIIVFIDLSPDQTFTNLKNTINATSSALSATIDTGTNTVTVTATDIGDHDPNIAFSKVGVNFTLAPPTGGLVGGATTDVSPGNLAVFINNLDATYQNLVQQINLHSTSVTAMIDTTSKVVTVTARDFGLLGNDIVFTAFVPDIAFVLAPSTGKLAGGTDIHAGGHLIYTGQPVDGETIQIGTAVYEFDDDNVVTGNNAPIQIGTTADATYSTLATQVAVDGVVTVLFNSTTNRLDFTAVVNGTAGNSIVFSGTITNATLFPAGGFLSGAVNGAFADFDAPTCDEVRDYINARVTGFTASCDMDGHLIITSDTSGLTSALVVGHGSANGTLGFANDTGQANNEKFVRPAWRINVGSPAMSGTLLLEGGLDVTHKLSESGSMSMSGRLVAHVTASESGSMPMSGSLAVLVKAAESGSITMSGDVVSVLTPPGGATVGIIDPVVKDSVDNVGDDKIGLEGFIWSDAADAKSRVPLAVTMKKLIVRIGSALTGSETLSFELYVNGSPSGLIATFNNGTGTTVTGTGTVAVADGDSIHIFATLGGGLTSKLVHSYSLSYEV